MNNTLELQITKIKHSKIVDAIKAKLNESYKEQFSKIDIEKETQYIVATDIPCSAYKRLMTLYPKAAHVFKEDLERRIRFIEPSYENSVSYKDRNKIETKVTEFALNYDTFTFDQVYEFATNGMQFIKNENELITR
jgi:hypothetical protein